MTPARAATAAHLLALMGCAVGCGRPPDAAPSPAPKGSGAHPSAQATASASAPAASAVPQLPRLLPDGCYAGVDPKLSALPKLQAIAARCVAGMVPLLSTPALVVSPKDGRQEVEFALDDANKCVRAIAAADSQVTDIELSIVDSSNAIVGQDELPGSFAMVAPDGPVCPTALGKHRAVLRLVPPSGPVALQVWVAK